MKFVKYVKRTEAYFKTHGHFLALIGDDFRWENAQRVYYNVDKLIKYVNQDHSDSLYARYSTVNDYLDAVMSVKEMF